MEIFRTDVDYFCDAYRRCLDALKLLDASIPLDVSPKPVTLPRQPDSAKSFPDPCSCYPAQIIDIVPMNHDADVERMV